MTTRLDKPLRRELEIDGELYTVTLDPAGVKITGKGKRKGHTLTWQALLSGEAELTQSLKISLDALGG
ncbi:MAG: hypothetical protein M3068_14265 [Gemmatimonadota bacterium]|nr:hypothetical protein [Gemmatimonadota bacterium]